MSNSIDNKKFLIDLSKSILPSTSSSLNKFQKSNNSSFNSPNTSIQRQRLPTSPNSSGSSSCTASSSSLLFSTSSTSNPNKSAKFSPTPSLVSNCSIISAHTLTSTTTTNTESCSTSCDCNNSNKTCSSSNSSMSSSSSSIYSCIHDDICNSDDSNFDKTKLKNISKQNSSSVFSTSISNDSLTTNNSNTNSIKRVTRNTSKAVNVSNSIVAQESTLTNGINNLNGKKCQWLKCKYMWDPVQDMNNEAFIEHVKSKHIQTQRNSKKFRCLWKGCNVYKNLSCSFIWLERHVIDHIDSRPFLCIFNGCNRKFRTELDREKHVQTHINSTSSSGTRHNGLSSSQSPSPVKTRQQKKQFLNSAKIALIQNIKNKNKLNGSQSNLSASNKTNSSQSINGKDCNFESNTNSILNGFNKMNTIKKDASNSDQSLTSKTETTGQTKFQNYSQVLKALTKKRKTQSSNDSSKKRFKKAQFKDYLDACSLKVIDDKLDKLSYKSGNVTLNANIIGSSVNNTSGVESFLVEWHPKHIIEDEWVEKASLSLTKVVNVNELFSSSNGVCKKKVINDKNPFYRRHRFRFSKRK